MYMTWLPAQGMTKTRGQEEYLKRTFSRDAWSIQRVRRIRSSTRLESDEEHEDEDEERASTHLTGFARVSGGSGVRTISSSCSSLDWDWKAWH